MVLLKSRHVQTSGRGTRAVVDEALTNKSSFADNKRPGKSEDFVPQTKKIKTEEDSVDEDRLKQENKELSMENFSSHSKTETAVVVCNPDLK